MTMSRIQDILARAERDGTARRTQPSPTLVPPATELGAPDYGPPATHGSSALDAAPFITLKEPVPPVAPAVPMAAAGAPVLAPAVPPALVDARVATHTVPADVVDGRTEHAVLHPALVSAIAPHSAIAEHYRAIRGRITQHEEHSPLRTVMVTSPGGSEGKSITAANLALTMAQEFQRQVVLVDADLRRPSVQALFGIDGTGPGLSEVLAGEATLDEALVYLSDYRLTLLPAGTAPHFPTELLGSAAMRRVLDTLRARFDRVLLDLPAVMPLADVGTVAPLADGVVMVVRAGLTQRPALDQALAVLEDTKILGVVLNEVH
jgi:capsular exopolysaccharide synthesis family protein